jgi:hypothetical protein
MSFSAGTGSAAVLVTFAALIRGRRSPARWAAIVAVASGLVELGRTPGAGKRRGWIPC